ncbi:MAG: hypothetical protein PHC61_05670 [Chitinivibrionales bacterium]|nr:hypothetical protein [Chitinivibrionales bacterium]
MRHTPALSFVFILGILGCDNPIPITSPDNSITVTWADFGYYMRDTSTNQVVFKSDSTIPTISMFPLVWRLGISTRLTEITWVEELIAPGRQDVINNGDPELIVSPDGTRSITKVTSSIRNGSIERNDLFIAGGDPAGNYTLNIYIEGKFARAFHFIARLPDSADSALLPFLWR